MRLRPETSPELDDLKKKKVKAQITDDDFDALVAQGPTIEKK